MKKDKKLYCTCGHHRSRHVFGLYDFYDDDDIPIEVETDACRHCICDRFRSIKDQEQLNALIQAVEEE